MSRRKGAAARRATEAQRSARLEKRQNQNVYAKGKTAYEKYLSADKAFRQKFSGFVEMRLVDEKTGEISEEFAYTAPEFKEMFELRRNTDFDSMNEDELVRALVEERWGFSRDAFYNAYIELQKHTTVYKDEQYFWQHLKDALKSLRAYIGADVEYDFVLSPGIVSFEI